MKTNRKTDVDENYMELYQYLKNSEVTSVRKILQRTVN